MKFAGWYGIVVGGLMLGQWSLSLATGQVPELQAEPWRIAFHLAAEFSTAAALIVSGVGLLRRLAWAAWAYPVAAGMLLYSVIVSPGYFAQLGQWLPAAMFAVLLVLTLGTLGQVFHAGPSEWRHG